MKPIILTYGMGIGPEITRKALKQELRAAPIVLVGRECSFGSNIPTVSCVSDLGRYSLSIWKGRLSDAEPPEVAAVRWGVEQCLAGQASALVTGPINKAKLVSQGFTFKGHTDFISSLCGAEAVMGFVGAGHHVALVTHHIPLMQVSSDLSYEKIIKTVHVAECELRKKLGIQRPRIVLCGLNPHAGEEGVLGTEELNVITPAANLLREQGFDLEGPVSAETAFVKMVRKEKDLLVAMYHDQALVPLKALAFGKCVNWSMGLPIIRCSVDHGTADELVGTNQADPSSLLKALRLAEHLAQESDKLSEMGLLKPA